MKDRFKTKLALAAIGLFAFGLLCPSIHATTITGTVTLGGSATASGPSGFGLTTVSFLSDWCVAKRAGDYMPVSMDTPSAFNGFSFTGDGTDAVLTEPRLSEWSFTFGGLTYTFDVLSLTSGHTEGGAMAFTGTGVGHITGFADTVASWSLAGSSSNGFMFKVAFDSTSPHGESVPDNGVAVALLGLAVAGLEGLRRIFNWIMP